MAFLYTVVHTITRTYFIVIVALVCSFGSIDGAYGVLFIHVVYLRKYLGSYPNIR